MRIPFYKYQGTGNDFVMIDNRDQSIQLEQKQIEWLCDRRFGIGADGLILLQEHAEFDFQMIYYNSDGRESSMCGNGGRCIIAYAKRLGVIDDNCSFLAIDGPHEGKIEEKRVSLKMGDVLKVEIGENFYVLDTGSPHYVTYVDDVKNISIVEEAREIRYNDRFVKEGINVNFISGNSIRTYERGVEDETLSCGTGTTACAIVQAISYPDRFSKGCKLNTEGGELEVVFEKIENAFKDVWLIGPAEFVFKGEINV